MQKLCVWPNVATDLALCCTFCTGHCISPIELVPYHFNSGPIPYWSGTIFFLEECLLGILLTTVKFLPPCYQLIISINILLMLDHAVEQLKFPWWGSVLYCKPHYDQLFILAGTLGSQLDQVEFPESNVRAAHWFCKDEGKHFKIY